ncbi:MAG: lysine-sensitive aspartokinase 3 [Bdellovibrionales bacterium]|nr:lysine-sensitive aspartokinase 3 [Bdellovibrionales bacterium]
MIIVSKFGGSSMADKTAMVRSANVITKSLPKIVVVSATYGTTNQLLSLIDTAINSSWKNVTPIIESISSNHKKIAEDLNSNTLKKLELLLTELSTFAQGICLLNECSPKATDRILSLGERMSSLLFQTALTQIMPEKTIELLDARKIIKTNNSFNEATPIPSEIKKLCSGLDLTSNIIYITQGFIGSNDENETTTLGRGGSDYSAALIAEGISADKIEIWTDVAGIATTDPRICKNATPIPELTFKEAAEMAVFGAKILHPTTLTPAMRSKIGVFVGSSYEPEKKGTWIRKQTDKTPLVRALAIRPNQSLITLSTPLMLNTHGFLYEIFKIFNHYSVSVDAITTAEISVSLTVNNNVANHLKLINDLKALGNVKIEKDLSLISLIGNNINHTAGLAKDVFNEIEDINIRMICQGASLHNFCFLVSDQEGENVVKSLHRKFIEGKNTK